MFKVILISDTDAATFHSSVNARLQEISDNGYKFVDIKYTSHTITTEYKNGIPSKSSVLDRALIIYEVPDVYPNPDDVGSCEGDYVP